MKRVILLLLTTVILPFSGCDYIKEKLGDSKKVIENMKSSNVAQKTPEEIAIEQITAASKKYFPDSPSMRKVWIERQIEARNDISSYMPDMPIKDYALIRERAEAKYPSDYVERKKYIYAQTEAYIRLKSSQSYFSDSEWKIVSNSIDKVVVDDFVKRIEKMEEWRDACYAIRSHKAYFERSEYDTIVSKIIKKYESTPSEISGAIRALSDCCNAYNRYYIKGVKRDVQILVKKRLDEIYGIDYKTKLEKLKVISLVLIKRPDTPLDTLIAGLELPKETEKKKSQREEEAARRDADYLRAQKIFRESMFTMRGPEDTIYTAALVRMKGKMVILATKDFIPEKFPVVFANSRGTIKCSKGFIAEKYSMVLLIPDEEPRDFTPIEIVNREDSLNLFDRELFLVSPHKGAFNTTPVSVFSEDRDYLVMAEGSNPHTTTSMSVKIQQKRGNNVYNSDRKITFVDQRYAGENSVIIDSKTGKLVSMAVNVYNAGLISEFSGKTGNIIGHEISNIPDYTTFVRHFDGIGQKDDKPNGSIRFIRMTAFQNWEVLDLSRFWKEKNEIRNFTDSNNEFLMFFIRNRYDNALTSRRLSKIAERYRRELVEYHKLTRESYETAYRKYMLEVLYALKRELNNKKPEEFYSVYREEYRYQLKLRQAMYKYLAEKMEDKNTTNIMHVDLRDRCNTRSIGIEHSDKSRYDRYRRNTNY